MFINKSEKTRLSTQAFAEAIAYLLSPETTSRSKKIIAAEQEKRAATKQKLYDSLPDPQSAMMAKAEKMGNYTFLEMRGTDVIVEDGIERQFAISPDGSYRRPMSHRDRYYDNYSTYAKKAGFEFQSQEVFEASFGSW